MSKTDWYQLLVALSPILKAISAMVISAILLQIMLANVQDSRFKAFLSKLGWIFLMVVFFIVLILSSST